MNTLGGITISHDGGLTWTRPASANPTQFFCSPAAEVREPSAFGIAFDPANPRNVYVGTNCGLAKSIDGGLSWSFINQISSSLKTRVFDVLVHHNGIIDICGDIGHRRSVNNGVDWNGPRAGGTPLPTGKCSLAVSPDESNVLFITVAKRIFESDNGGQSWDTEFVNPLRAGRIPFVVTNKRQGRNFDLWFGNRSIFRAGCKTPSTPGTSSLT